MEFSPTEKDDVISSVFRLSPLPIAFFTSEHGLDPSLLSLYYLERIADEPWIFEIERSFDWRDQGWNGWQNL